MRSQDQGASSHAGQADASILPCPPAAASPLCREHACGRLQPGLMTRLAGPLLTCLWPDSCTLSRGPEPLERITVRCDCGRQVGSAAQPS